MIGEITQAIPIGDIKEKEIYVLDINDLVAVPYVWCIEKTENGLKDMWYAVNPGVKTKIIEALEKYQMPKIKVKIYATRILDVGETKEGFEEIGDKLKELVKAFEIQYGGDRITLILNGMIVGRAYLGSATFMIRKIFELASQGKTIIEGIIQQEPNPQTQFPRIRYAWIVRELETKKENE